MYTNKSQYLSRQMFVLWILTLLTVGLSGCEVLDRINTSPEYQKTKQIVSSWVDYVGDKTTDFINNNETTKKRADQAEQFWQKVVSGAKAEADKLIEQGKQKLDKELEKIKDNVKQQVKSGVNAKIDESFDNL